MPITWKTVFNTWSAIEKLQDQSISHVAKLTSEAFGISTAELITLSEAIASQTDWIGLAQRDSRLSKACKNKKLFDILRSLFVLSKPHGLNYVTFENTISKKSANDEGLNLETTRKIIRIRKNKIMNWGTLNSNVKDIVSRESKTPLALLVPDENLFPSTIFFACDRVRKHLTNIYTRIKQSTTYLGTSLHFWFWRRLYYLASALINNTEYECFTYTERVPCTAYKLTRASMKRAAFIAMKAEHEAYGNRQQVISAKSESWEAWNKKLHQNGAAICLCICPVTKRFLLDLRGENVDNPHTYGLPGGALNNKETPKQGALREFYEETGKHLSQPVEVIAIKPKLWLAVVKVDAEFKPKVSNESSKVVWVSKLPNKSKLHPEMRSLYSTYVKIIQSVFNNASSVKAAIIAGLVDGTIIRKS